MSLFAIFLMAALPLYAAMHVYLYRKLARAFTFPTWFRRFLPALLAVALLAPFLGRFLDHDGHIWLARAINLPAYLWVAWIFWFCIAGLSIDVLRAAFRFFSRQRNPGSDTDDKAGARRQLAFIAGILILTTTWGVIEAAHPRVFNLVFATAALPPGSAPIRIVQISDVHFSTFRGLAWSRDLALSVAALQPDLLLSTGDMIDSSTNNIGEQADNWAALQPPLGKFAILGNHEYYAGLANAEAFHERAGFRLLRGTGVNVGTGLRLYGMDDPAGLYTHLPCFLDESVLSRTADPARFTILLKHQPRVAPHSIGRFDLQLSGHTHGGQIFPFHAVVRLLYPITHGSLQLNARSLLYVSRGTGTWGPPLRLFAPPEITVITLRPK